MSQAERSFNFAFHGTLWASAYLALILAPLAVLLVGSVPPGTTFAWDFAVALGFSALSLMGSMFLLTARFQWTTRAFGIDIIYFFHRWVALIAFVLLLGHPVILLGVEPLLIEYLKPNAPWHMLAGAAALLAVILQVATSIWRKYIGLEYDTWRRLHALLAMTAIVLAVAHIVGVNYYIEAPWKHELWFAFAASWIVLMLYLRLVRPWRISRRPYRVADIKAERGDAWTLTLEPVGHAGLRFLPGQFVWLCLWHSALAMREHPFSISSSAEQPQRLSFTIKKLGDFTARLSQVTVGQAACLDGPFGAFSIDRYPGAPGYVFVAGGVGIAPILGMLKTLADRGDERPVWLFYAYKNLDYLTAYDQLQALQSRVKLNLVVILNDAPADWTGERGLLSEGILRRHLPDNYRDLEYFLCGPTVMTAAAERDLERMGISVRHIHTELFEMA